LRKRTRRRRNGTAMRSLGGGSNRYAGHFVFSGVRPQKVSGFRPNTHKTERRKSLIIKNSQLTNLRCGHRLFSQNSPIWWRRWAMWEGSAP
jgi:hypothetical protein